MKRLVILVLILIDFCLMLSAQNFVNEYGKIGKDDVEFTSYEKDKSAEAVIIYDIGSSYFEHSADSYELIYERITRIKVFKEAGIKWAKIEIPFYQKGDIYEQIEDLEACTYNFEDGVLTRTNLDINNSHDEIINEFWRTRKFAMPNVKEGSIIEYHYKIRSQYMFNLRSWEFQSKIPVIYSKYIVKMIPFYEYTYLLQGAGKFDDQKSYEDTYDNQFGPVKYHDMIHEFVMKDIPAFKDEEYISTIDDYIIKIGFQLSKVTQVYGAVEKILTTWPELIKNLLKDDNFGRYADKSEKVAAKIFDLKNLSLKPTREKFDSIMNYVKVNYSWNKINRKYTYKNPTVFLKDKIGSSAEINLFAVGLLKACGVQAIPVILSTRENGKIKYDYPFDYFFNYVCILVDIDGKKILTDATDPLLTNDRLPLKCLNDKGLLIQKDKVEWVNLQSNLSSKERTFIVQNLSESTQVATVEVSETEYDALASRKNLGSKINEIQKELTDKGYSIVDSSIVVKNQNLISEPYLVKYKTEQKVEKINDKIYISPFLQETIKENPLKQTERTYPIDIIYPIKRTFVSQINIPDGYKVDFLPSNDKISNDQFELEYSAVADETKVQVNLIYYFKTPIYRAEDYSKVKYYFKDIVTKGTAKIVLAKK